MELTADQIEQAGRLLMPAFREAVRAEMAATIEPIRKDVEELKKVKWRVAMSYGAIVAVVTGAYHVVRDVKIKALLERLHN